MFFRAPRTTQEKRYDALLHTQLAEIAQDHGPFRSRLRNGRGGFGLPTTYDDIIVKCQRTWKKTRRTQYREKRTSPDVMGEVIWLWLVRLVVSPLGSACGCVKPLRT